MTQPAPQLPAVVITPADAAAYLAQMNIDVDVITNAIRNGETAASNLTRYHPVTGPGLVRWIEVVGGLRSGLASTGHWNESDPQNRPISEHEEGRYSLSTIGGTDTTGIAGDPSGPRAARRKGRATAAAIDVPALFTLEDLLGTAPDAYRVQPPAGQWFLVYFRDEHEIRMEVSLPLGFDPDAGQFTGWKVRVILDSWETHTTEIRPGDVGGQDVDFHIGEVG